MTTFFEDIGSQRPNLLACHNPYQPHEIDPPQIGAWMLQRHRPQEVSVFFFGVGGKEFQQINGKYHDNEYEISEYEW